MTAPVHNPEVVHDLGLTGHSGRDYRTEPGTPIRATLAGVVVQSEAGRVAVESNAIWHLYSDLSELAVSQGETVETGTGSGSPAVHICTTRSGWRRTVPVTTAVRSSICTPMPGYGW